MTEVAHVLTREDDAADLLTEQFKNKPTLDAFLRALVSESQTLEDVANELRTERTISSAVGIQLDRIGAIVGETRRGRSDDVYRLWIKARVRVNRSSGGTRDMYAVAKLVLGADASLWLRQFPVGHVLQVDGFSDADPYEVQRILQQTSAAGVPFFYWHQPFADEPTAYRFTFASGSAPVSSSNYGFDSARLIGAIGPGSSPDYRSKWERVFGADLVDVVDVRGLDGELSVDAGASTWGLRDADLPFSVTPLAYKDTISKMVFSGTLDRLQTQHAASLVPFEVGGPFAVSWYGSRRTSPGSDYVFRVDDGAASRIHARFVTNTLRLVLNDGSITNFVGPTVSDTNEHAWTISYDGAGSAAFWVDGAKTSTSGTHRSPTGLTTLMFGGQLGNPMGESPFFLTAKRSITDDEAAALHEIMLREFTDTYS